MLIDNLFFAPTVHFMRTPAQLQQALAKISNVAEFARKHRLALRTVWRVRCGGAAHRGTMMQINDALNREKS
jgi:hypothetical protein